MKGFCIVTTINKPTKAIEELYDMFRSNLIIVGDKKTPLDWNYLGIKPINTLSKLYAPNNHYARKNLGYLEAIKNEATFIYDTDDDNIPDHIWHIRDNNCKCYDVYDTGWCNVYSFFTNKKIWPRGFSLREINTNKKYLLPVFNEKHSSIQQGISDGSPDVDAIWRLTNTDGIVFEKIKDIWLGKNVWCPFNSQSTWWFPKAYPLMYLPVYASFRMTDIWRSFVAQRCLWEIGEGVTFHSPAEVFQDRNKHDLLRDFEDEISGYLKNDLIVQILGELELKFGEKFICENLLTCYQALVEKDILPQEEIDSVKQWIKDYGYITGNLE